ncbi:MAG TPA: hypothetical protein VIU11_24340 [Nakamurella sp.]
MQKVASWVAIVVGIVMVIAGIATWVVISNTLASQRITVAADADCAAGDDVNGPISAFCQAAVIDKHTLNITGGKTYSELDRDDPNRATAMNSAFLQASLFTSVVAFGVCLMAIGVGAVLALIGFALRSTASARAPSEAATT